jgi:putative flippase GtrA
VAYAIAYAAGIVLSYALNARWVFRHAWTRRGLASFALGYGLQALLSYGLFLWLLAWTPIPAWLAPVVVTIVLLPLTFLVNRTLVQRTSSPLEAPR